MSQKTISSFFDLIEQGARDFRDKPLFRYMRAGAEESVSYLAFYQGVLALTQSFLHWKMTGCRIALWGATSPEWVAFYMASVTAGNVVVPLDAGLDPDQIVDFLKKAEIDMIVADPAHEKLLAEHEGSLRFLKHRVCINPEAFLAGEDKLPKILPKKLSASAFATAGRIALATDSLYPHPVYDRDGMSVLLFTSGTTGSGKGVMLSENNICYVINEACRILNLVTKEDILLSILPIHHTYELTCGILAPMLFGCTICINDSLINFSRNLKRFQPTVMFMVPLVMNTLKAKIMDTADKQNLGGMLRAMLGVSGAVQKLRLKAPRKLFKSVLEGLGGRLRFIVVGGAALNPETCEFFSKLGIIVSQGYGITECAPLIAVMPMTDYNPTSCGKAIAGLEIRIDKESEEDETGEIVVRGPNVMLGYYQNEEATAEVMDDGWFRTGDYGRVDKKGYVYITGRKKSVIVLPGGKNVFPEEIEEYLEKISLIGECVVIGRTPDPDTVNITAVVYPDAERAKKKGLATQEEIEQAIRDEIARINRRLVAYKRIVDVEFRTEPFEKTTSKKIKRYLVK